MDEICTRVAVKKEEEAKPWVRIIFTRKYLQ